MPEKYKNELQDLNDCSIIFVCYHGWNRSRASSEALNDTGLHTGYYKGGTKEMSKKNVDELKKEIGGCANIIVIYDPSENQPGEFEAKELVIDKLKESNVDFEVWSNTKLATYMFDQDINLAEYMP